MGADIAGTARSVAEILFVVDSFACEVCGDRRPLDARTKGSGTVWIVEGECRRCRNERRYVFSGAPSLYETSPEDLELGGAEPSTILEPFAFVAEIDRLVPTIVTTPEQLEEPAWSVNSEAVDRVLTALNELDKFIPPDLEMIPAEAHRGGAGLVDQAARPERYGRTWIALERAHWRLVADRIASDAQRIFDADPMISRATPPRGRIDRETVAAHRAWVERGEQGAGRLDVVTTDACESELGGAVLSACRLEGVLLDDADLRAARLDRVEWIEVFARSARLDAAWLVEARLDGCRLEDASLQLARLDRAVLRGGSLDGAVADGSSWIGAALEGTSLRSVALADARLDGAQLIGCDLRGASLVSADPAATSAGARFERCDLRGIDLTGRDLAGATFVACKLAGAHGAPASTAGWTVIDADLSEAGDGSDLGDATDLLDELTRG